MEGTWTAKVTCEIVVEGSSIGNGERTGGTERVTGCDGKGDWDVAKRGTVGVGEEERVWPNEDKGTYCVGKEVGSGWLGELELGLMLGEGRGYSWIVGLMLGSEGCEWVEDIWGGLLDKDWEDKKSISLNRTFLEM